MMMTFLQYLQHATRICLWASLCPVLLASLPLLGLDWVSLLCLPRPPVLPLITTLHTLLKCQSLLNSGKSRASSARSCFLFAPSMVPGTDQVLYD